MVGEVEKEENVLVVKRIHVTYHLKLESEHRVTAERVHSFHARFCPVARTIRDSVDITTELVMEEIPEKTNNIVSTDIVSTDMAKKDDERTDWW